MQQSSAVIPEICVYNAVVTTRRVTSLTAGFLDPRFECVGSRTNQLVNRASFINTGALILRKERVYKRIYFPAKIAVAAAGCRSRVASMNGLQASIAAEEEGRWPAVEPVNLRQLLIELVWCAGK